MILAIQEAPDKILPYPALRTRRETNPPTTLRRNDIQLLAGYIHILDYNHRAKKEKHVITHLTIYALALSRRTGIPVKSFSCAWFDDKDYFVFFPLPAVYPRH